MQDRQDDFLASNHAREQVYKLTYAVDANAVVQAIKADISVAVGAYASFPMGSSLEANGGPRNLPGPYRFSQFAFNTRAVLTHTCPTGAFRGVSAPSALFAVEGMMDLIAKRYGLDPVEVRRRNLIQPHELPFTNAMGQQYGHRQPCRVFGLGRLKLLTTTRRGTIRQRRTRATASCAGSVWPR